MINNNWNIYQMVYETWSFQQHIIYLINQSIQSKELSSNERVSTLSIRKTETKKIESDSTHSNIHEIFKQQVQNIFGTNTSDFKQSETKLCETWSVVHVARSIVYTLHGRVVGISCTVGSVWCMICDMCFSSQPWHSIYQCTYYNHLVHSYTSTYYKVKL